MRVSRKILSSRTYEGYRALQRYEGQAQYRFSEYAVREKENNEDDATRLARLKNALNAKVNRS